MKVDYPLATTTTPISFASPSYNGIFLPSTSVYIHAEYASSGSYLKSAKADGTLIQNLPNTATNAFDLAKVGDSLISFGELANIVLINIQYILPTFFVYVGMSYPGHNLNLRNTLTRDNSSVVYVTTSSGGKLHKFSLPNLNAPLLSQTYTDHSGSSINNAVYLDSSTILLTGGAAFITLVDAATMAQLTSNAGPSMVLRVLVDQLANVSVPVIDIADNSLYSVSRYNWTASGPVSVNQLTLPGAISNFIEFQSINYLAVSQGTNMIIIKRSNYTTIQTFAMAGTLFQNSVACSSLNRFKYTFSAVMLKAVPLQTIFTTHTVNLDFCNSYNGDICTECLQPFKLNNNSEGNRCISIDEYPLRSGVKGTAVAPCIDSNCIQCKNSFFRCEICPSPSFINMANYNCSNLTINSGFGRDLTNASIIRPCKNSDCVDCTTNYLKCTFCPIEYFRLVSDTCERKAGNMTFVSGTLDAERSLFLFNFSNPFVIDPQTLFPDKLNFTILDYKGEEYKDFSNPVFSTNDARDTLILSLELHTSLYNANITITQLSQKSIFYDNSTYLAVTDEFTIQNLRYIISDAYKSLLSKESALQKIIWPIMILAVLFGTPSHPWYSTLLMRTISMCNIISHMNGPNLHASDLFFDIIGHTAFPLSIDALKTPIGDQSCEPPSNFMKIFERYYSCNFIDLYGTSLVFFLLMACVACPISVVAFRKLRVHRKKQVEDPTHTVDNEAAKWSVVDGLYGLRWLLIVFEASMPITVQYSFLSILSEGSSVTSDLVSVATLTIAAAFTYCMFRFIYNYLDIQQLNIIKARRFAAQGVVPEQGANVLSKEEKTGKMLSRKGKGVNRVYPRKVAAIVIGHQEATLNLEPFKAERGIDKQQFKAEFNLDDIHSLPLGGSVENHIVNTRFMQFSKLDFCIWGFKRDVSQSRSFFYYLPLLEMVNLIVASFALVRFSEGGMVQIYVLVVFEFIIFCLTVWKNPFEKQRDLAVFMLYKLLIILIYSARLVNYSDLKEQGTRQDLLDPVILLFGVCLVSLATVVSAIQIILGIKVVCGVEDALQEELKCMENDKKEVENKMVVVPPDNRGGLGLDESDLNEFMQFEQSESDRKQAMEKRLKKKNKKPQEEERPTNEQAVNSSNNILKRSSNNTLTIVVDQPFKNNQGSVMMSDMDEFLSRGSPLLDASKINKPSRFSDPQSMSEAFGRGATHTSQDQPRRPKVDRLAEQIGRSQQQEGKQSLTQNR